MFFKIAFKNLLSRKIKIIVIGSVIAFGSMIAVIGGSFVESMSDGMRKSITNSVSGDIQLYSSASKERLSVTGGPGGNFPDIEVINNFKEIKDLIINNVPNVKAVVAQGVSMGVLNPGNILDIKLSELRKFKGSRAEEQALKDHVKSIISNIQKTYVNNVTEIGSISDEDLEKDKNNLKESLSDKFWSSFDFDRNNHLEFLENKIAPLIYDDSTIFFLYMGVVPEQHIDNFPLVQIVEGTEIPKGKRGFLFNQAVYEEQIKHKIARRLDTIKEAIEKEKRIIKGDKELEDRVKSNIDQVSEIYNQLNPLQTKQLLPKLRTFLGSSSEDINDLCVEFLKMNDENFKSRYKFFYDEIAPKIILYKIKIGDVFPLQTITKNGYAKSINLKVYGVFKYKNFENSPLMGHYNVMDLMSFRDLYGFMSNERMAETAKLEKEMEKIAGSLDMGEEDMEKIFDEGKQKVITSNSSATISDKIDKKDRVNVIDLNYTDEQMENGECLNVAIILKDPSQIKKTMVQIDELNKKHNLKVNVINWLDASGTLGQFTYAMKVILYIFIAVIFIVAMFIIMNSMLMATMERTKEIGTMRAMGAQKSYVLKLILAETSMLSFIFGMLGIFIGLVVVIFFHYFGIPAGNSQVFLFLFSGPRLYLSVELIYILAVLALIIFVSLIASYYPARKAASVPPITAMSKGE